MWASKLSARGLGRQPQGPIPPVGSTTRPLCRAPSRPAWTTRTSTQHAVPAGLTQRCRRQVQQASTSAPGHGAQDVAVAAAREEPTALESPVPVSDVARRALDSAAKATRQVGWLSFWVQLSLSIVSAIILLFSVAFTSQNGPGISLYLTLFGIVAGFLSTFWAYGFTRLSRRLKGYAQAGPQANIPRIRKKDVLTKLEQGCYINIAGMVATLLGLQATVGLLVAKTLTNATANPFLSGGAGSYNPVLALDVFLVQASTNTLLSHFTSLLACLWLIRVVGRNSATPAGGMVPAKA